MESPYLDFNSCTGVTQEVLKNGNAGIMKIIQTLIDDSKFACHHFGISLIFEKSKNLITKHQYLCLF